MNQEVYSEPHEIVCENCGEKITTTTPAIQCPKCGVYPMGMKT